MNDLPDALCRPSVYGNLYLDRRIQQVGCQAPDVRRERCREQQVLSILGKHSQYLADVPNKAHIEHAVRLVEHQKLDRVEIDGSLPQMIEQPAGCRHDNVRALAQVSYLRIDAHPAVDDGSAKRQMPPIGANAVRNLCGQFSRGRQYEGANPPAVSASLL